MTTTRVLIPQEKKLITILIQQKAVFQRHINDIIIIITN